MAEQALSVASQELAANPDSVPAYKALVEINNQSTAALGLAKSASKD